MTVRILLTHIPAARALYYGEAERGLQRLGTLVLHQHDAPLADDALCEAAANVDIVVADRATAFPAAVIERLSRTAAIVRVAVDYRNIDVSAASSMGILITHASPGFGPAVAELLIGFMIDCARGISAATCVYRVGRAPAIRMGRQLRGGTVGILGYGLIGKHLAAAASALGMRVLVHDPYVEVPRAMELASLEDLLGQSDFVVPLAVATDETENLIDEAALRRMKKTAFLINASRGNLVDETALANALAAETIAGAAMDVGRAPDQMPSPALAQLENVIATPHIGGLVQEAVAHQANETVRQVEAIVAGRLPPGAINADHAPRLRNLTT